MYIWEKGRAAGWVGSGQTFCRQSRVGSTFRRVGQGPRKVTRGQLCRGQLWTPMGSSQRSQRHIQYCWIWLGSKCGMCSFSANSSIRHWGKIKMFAWKVELYTRLHGFKNEFSKFSGVPKPSPQIPPPPNFGLRFQFGLRPQISGTSFPRFGLHPQFTPNMFDHFPKQGKLQIKYFTPLPQLLGYATVFYNSILQIVTCR